MEYKGLSKCYDTEMVKIVYIFNVYSLFLNVNLLALMPNCQDKNNNI